MKKIEIVTDTLELDKVAAILDRVKVSGYTVIRDVQGKGARGVRNDDQLTDVMNNSYIVTVCAAEQVEPVIKAVRPILKKFGGVCVVSDCQWIAH